MSELKYWENPYIIKENKENIPNGNVQVSNESFEKRTGEFVKFKNENIATKIHDYVCKNLAFDLSSDAICRNFLISRTKLYEISNKSFGMSISEFVTKKRIEKEN